MESENFLGEKTTKPFPTKMSLENGKTYEFCGCEYSKVF
jgi:hypothetical protein